MKKINEIIIIAIFANIILLFLPRDVNASNYYLLTYEQGRQNMTNDVYLKSINLDSATIKTAIKISNKGFISEKKPMNIYVGNNLFLLACVENTFQAKNSNSGQNIVYYSIFRTDNGLSLIRSDSIPNASIEWLSQDQDERTFRFGLTRYDDTIPIIPTGIYSLDSTSNFLRIGPFDPESWPDGIRNLNHFRFLHRVNMPNIHNLFYAVGPDGGYWAVRLNALRNSIIDSVMLQTGLSVSTIFAYHPRRNKLYCFYLNYENHGNMPETEKNFGQDWSTPEVLIFDPLHLNLIEHHSIADFTSGNYPGIEKGLADVVGDYIVYYSFETETTERFYPAMLFIFDTRTNQATWLRVGWR
jgi:hypothetical protein